MKAFIPYGLIVLHRYYIRNKNNVKNDNDFIWAMTENEQKLFREYIFNAKIYMEFGSGGSTITALKDSKGKIYSVESSNDWIKTMRKKYEVIKKAEDSGRLNLIYADIGKTGKWGTPIMADNENDADRFFNYSHRIFEKYPEIKFADVVLIDGRFRVASFLSTLLNNDVNTIYMFHDFWNRPKYHIVKKFVNIIDGIDTLMVCKKDPASSNDEIKKEYENYKYNYE